MINLLPFLNNQCHVNFKR